MVAGFVLVLGSVPVLLAYQGQYEERIYPGVTVGGISVAGLTREAAAATLERELVGYGSGTAVVGMDGSEMRIPYAALGRRADVATLVDLAWSVGRSEANPVGRAARGVRSLLDGTAIQAIVVLDPEAVGREVAAWPTPSTSSRSTPVPRLRQRGRHEAVDPRRGAPPARRSPGR